MSETHIEERFNRLFFERIPPAVAHSFSEEQIAAVRTAFMGERWDGHRVDVRGTVPLPGGRWYFVFVAGPDRRGGKRRRQKRRRAPLRRAFGFAVSAVIVIWFAALLGYVFLPEGLLTGP